MILHYVQDRVDPEQTYEKLANETERRSLADHCYETAADLDEFWERILIASAIIHLDTYRKMQDPVLMEAESGGEEEAPPPLGDDGSSMEEGREVGRKFKPGFAPRETDAAISSPEVRSQL